MKNKLYSIIILVGAVLSLIINLMMYSKLPEKVAMQMSLSGNLQNFVPKTIFIVIAPLILVIDYFYATKAEESKKFQAIFVAVIVFAINIVGIYFNIK